MENKNRLSTREILENSIAEVNRKYGISGNKLLSLSEANAVSKAASQNNNFRGLNSMNNDTVAESESNNQPTNGYASLYTTPTTQNTTTNSFGTTSIDPYYTASGYPYNSVSSNTPYTNGYSSLYNNNSTTRTQTNPLSVTNSKSYMPSYDYLFGSNEYGLQIPDTYNMGVNNSYINNKPVNYGSEKPFKMVGLTEENPYKDILYDLGVGEISKDSKYYDDVMKTIKTNNGVQPEYGTRDIKSEIFNPYRIGHELVDSFTIDNLVSPIGQRYNANLDLLKNYIAMLLDETKYADDYFHCKANYEATSRGPLGEYIAKKRGKEKEVDDFYKNINEKGLSEEQAMIDYYHDKEINRIGRELYKSGNYKNSKDACNMFRVNGINPMF